MSMDPFALLQDGDTPKIEPKPWMVGGPYRFILGTVANLAQIIDECIASGLYSTDLETTGLDSRVFNGETVSKIVGCCLSPDGKRGYYIPLRHRNGTEHNVPWSLFKKEFLRLIRSKARAIFHNGKFDQEFLQSCGGEEPLGEWDEPSAWEDTLILSYLRDTRSKSNGLKHLAKTELGLEMIELEELFDDKRRKSGELDFSELDPSWEPVCWYGASDAICTWNLYPRLAPGVLEPKDGNPGQGFIYALEKLCVASTRWMERARVFTDQNKARELIRIGQKEWISSLEEVYTSAGEILGRDIRPGYYRLLRGEVERPDAKGFEFDPEEVAPAYMERVDAARGASLKMGLDPRDGEKKNAKIATLSKRVPSLTQKGVMEEVAFPQVYDVLAPVQLGALLRECKVPGLKATEKSGQVATDSEELERVLSEVGDKFPFAKKIMRFREVAKALGTYLLPLIEDCAPDGTLRANFNAFSVETGRFAAKSSKRPKVDGGTRFPWHGTPATYDPSRPECLARVRECIIARPGSFIVAIDFSGVELRIVTNLSHEPKWLREFFHCSSCDKMFPAGDGSETPVAPPPYCPDCGSDKIGDLHTLTGINVFGEDAPKRPEWKKLRGDAKCVHSDTLVFGEGGVSRIGRYPLGPEGEFRDSPGSAWKSGGLVPVRQTYNGGQKPLYHVVTRRGILTCSAEHKFATSDGRLVSVEDGLVKGVELFPVTHPSLPEGEGAWPELAFDSYPRTPRTYIRTDANMAYFAGVYCGDGIKAGVSGPGISHGHVSKTDRLGVPYSQWQAVLMEACRAAGLDPRPFPAYIDLGCRHVARYLTALELLEDSRGSRRLKVPQWVLEAGKRAILPFLGGLFDTDGTVNKEDAAVSWTTKDAVFAGQVAALLRCLGAVPYVGAEWNPKYRRWYYSVRINKSDNALLHPYFRHPGKRARLTVGKPGRRAPDMVTAVIPAGTGPCMDLSLGTEDHLYWTNGYLTHNSCNFTLCYGGGGTAVVASIGCDKNEGWRIKEQFDSTYKVLSAWWKEQHKFARKHKYVLTPFGRRYPLPDIDHEMGGFRSKAERNAVNGPVQGASADITKLAMGLIYKECKRRGWLDRVRMLITMHDELVFEIEGAILEEAIDAFVPLMCRNPALLRLKWPVPLTSDVEIGKDWTVKWDLKKIRSGKDPCPPELAGLLKVGAGSKPKAAPEAAPAPRASSVRVVRLQGFSLGEVDRLARLIRSSKPTSTARLRVEGPDGSDLTGAAMTVWGGPLPLVDEETA